MSASTPKLLSSEESLLKLAKILAVNYVDVSICHEWKIEGLDTAKASEKRKEYLAKVLKKPDETLMGVSRNILVIGNGASAQFCGSASQILESVEEKLWREYKLAIPEGTDQPRIINQKYEEALTRYAREFVKFGIIPKSSDLKRYKELTFEERLAALSEVVGYKVVVRELKKHVGMEYYPSKFYEMVAHLFKHRFIDVIINFNFDELLDNAIKDEMGKTAYKRVIHDSDCESIDELSDGTRLRYPIYIKPHGTISSESTLRFTKQHYIDISSKVEELIQNLLNGKLNNKSDEPDDPRIEEINIITAGFALGSIEFNKYLSDQCHELFNRKTNLGKDVRIRYFPFDIDLNGEKPILKRLQDFYEGQKDFVDTDKKDVAHADDVKRKTQFIKENIEYEDHFITCSKFEIKSDERLDIHHLIYDENDVIATDVNTLGEWFEILFDRIKEQIREKYHLQNTVRHKLLLEVFPEETSMKLHKSLINSADKNRLVDFLERRAHFYLIYDLIKYNGIIRLPVSDGVLPMRYDRYANLYRQDPQHQYTDHLYDTLKLWLENGNSDPTNVFEVSSMLWYYAPLQYNQIEKMGRERLGILPSKLDQWKRMEKFKNYSKKDAYAEILNLMKTKLRTGEIKSIDLDNLEWTSINDINSNYKDSRLQRFATFPKDRMIPTNLGFSYKFRKFFFEYNSEWDTLYFADDTLMPVLNLLYDAEKEYSSMNVTDRPFLKLRDKTFKVLYSDSRLLSNINKLKDDQKLTDFISDVVISHRSDENKIETTNELFKNLFKYYSPCTYISQEALPNQFYDHMALFLKNNKPVFGIYFFKTGMHKVINPVFFRMKKCGGDDVFVPVHTDQINLKRMKNYFDQQFELVQESRSKK
jgi:hypothetical protein